MTRKKDVVEVGDLITFDSKARYVISGIGLVLAKIPNPSYEPPSACAVHAQWLYKVLWYVPQKNAMNHKGEDLFIDTHFSSWSPIVLSRCTT